MKYSVVESFTINSRIGPLAFPVGRLLELTEEQAAKFGDKVRLADMGSAILNRQIRQDWQPEFKAWLEGDSLRTTGSTDDLAGVIIELTTDDLPLQRRLLKLHCGVYQGPWWDRLVERWQERAAIMEHDGGLAREQAELEAARCLRAEAFLEELKQTYSEV